MVGAPVVTREIQVRVLVGEPIRRDRLTGRTLGSQPNNRSSSLRRGASNAHVAQLDKAPDYESGRCRFESCRVLHSCEQDSRFGLRAHPHESALAEATLLEQRVGEPGRPCLPWKQEIGGSNPPALTTILNNEWSGS